MFSVSAYICSGREFLNESKLLKSYVEALDIILSYQPPVTNELVVGAKVYGAVEFSFGQQVSWNCPADELTYDELS